MKKLGRIIYNGVKLEPHEKATVRFLADRGYNIDVVHPQNIPKSKNADVLIDGVVWEIKCPETRSDKGLERIFQDAARQSDSLLINLKYIKFSEERALVKSRKIFQAYRRFRRMKIITKNGDFIDFYKR